METGKSSEEIIAAFLRALKSGESPDASDFARGAPEGERREVEADLRVAAFMYDNHYRSYVRPSVVKKAMAKLDELRGLERRIEDAETRLAASGPEDDRSLVERFVEALGISVTLNSVGPRGAAVFARGGAAPPASDRTLDKMSYRISRRRGIEAADDLVAAVDYTAPPVDLARACDYLRLLVSLEEQSNDVQGYLVTDGRVGGIVINKAIGDARRHRFTLAHEIGHFVLHRSKRSYVVDKDDGLDSPGDSSDEMEANAFAGALLMPSAMLAGEASPQEPTMGLVDEMSDVYDVSVCSAAQRLVSLSDWPCAFILSLNGVVQWAAYSERFDGYITRKRKVNPNTAADAVAESGVGSRLRLSLNDDVWLEPGRSGPRELQEESRNMGNGFVYSLIFFEE